MSNNNSLVLKPTDIPKVCQAGRDKMKREYEALADEADAMLVEAVEAAHKTDTQQNINDPIK